MIKQYKENIIERKIIEFYLMLLCFGVFISYMMVAPAMYFAIFFSLVIIKSQEGKILTGENVLLALIYRFHVSDTIGCILHSGTDNQ